LKDLELFQQKLKDHPELLQEEFLQAPPFIEIPEQEPSKVFVGVFPEEIVQIGQIQCFKGYSILPLTLFAAQYDSQNKSLYWNKKVKIEIEIEKPKILSTPLFYKGKAEDEAMIKDLVTNPDLLSNYKNIRSIESRTQNYKYVVITSPELASAFQPLIDQKIKNGLTATITTTSWIYQNYEGRDTQEKIRNFIKDYYTYCGTEYILPGGDVEVVPYRGVYANVAGAATDFNIPCDLYFSCLDGDWDSDKDSIFGELTDNVDLMPEVYVGRAPVNTKDQVVSFIDKIQSYETEIFTKMLFIIYWKFKVWLV